MYKNIFTCSINTTVFTTFHWDFLPSTITVNPLALHFSLEEKTFRKKPKIVDKCHITRTSDFNSIQKHNYISFLTYNNTVLQTFSHLDITFGFNAEAY